MKSLLFWKITGGYALLSGLALGGYLLVSKEGAADTTVVASWILSIAGFAMLAAKLITPLHKLNSLLRQHETGHEARDSLLRLRERRDDFGIAAKALIAMRSAHSEEIRQLTSREQEIRSSAMQLSAMLQSMVEGVVAVDEGERILFANNVFCSMFDLDTTTVAGRRVFEAVRNTHFQEVVHDAVANRQQTTIEFRLVKKDMQVSMSAAPISGSGAVLVLNDVSEVRRLESMRRDFVSGVSHELKTPLTVIQACTETLLDGAVDERETSRRFLRQIEEQSDRLLQLIVRMLHLARVESGEQVVTSEPVDLVAAGRHVLSSLMPVAVSKRITLTQDGDTELFVLTDREAIETVISNLVENSLKYTPDGGSVQVRVVGDMDCARLIVTDSGVGIPRADLERVFERFYRVNRDRNREDGGTGLGLAIVKHLCQAMGAEITLESSSGRGCSITVSFPFPD